MRDIRQTSNYTSYLSKIGWSVGKIEENYAFVKRIPLLGNVVKIQRPEKGLSEEAIKEIKRKYKPFQIIFEPKNVKQELSLKRFGLKLSKNTYLPSKTLELDLRPSKEYIYKHFKKDCSSPIEKNSQLKLKEYDVPQLEKFRSSWTKAVGLKRYVPPLSQLIALKEAFKENALFVTTQDYESGAIFLCTKDYGYYWQAFTSQVGRNKLYQYKIVWEGILWAKKKKAKMFDFEGIYDKRSPNKDWLGFSHFKKSFGGKEIEYPGCYVKTSLFF